MTVEEGHMMVYDHLMFEFGHMIVDHHLTVVCGHMAGHVMVV